LIKSLWQGLRRRGRVPYGPPVLAGVGTARAAFGPLTAKRDLVAAAAARVGPQLQEHFRRYVLWLQRLGYDFGSCEELRFPLERRRVYLRYDVHVRDLFGVFALAALHEELRIPGSFQICWEHSRAEEEVSDIFLKLQLFDSRFVEFGLHCSPESRWIVAERFEGRDDGLKDFVSSGEVRRMMADWLVAFEREGHEAAVLAEARRRAEASFAEVVASFRRSFGAVKTVSGHGTPLSAAYLDALATEPRLSALSPYLHPVNFLAPERIRRHGFAAELTQLPEDALPGQRIMFEGPIEDMATRYRERMAEDGGFVVLFHPGSWTSDYFRPFLDSVTEGAGAPATLER
jgi:hypothetical protein